MSSAFSSRITTLALLSNKFDEHSNSKRLQCLQSLSILPLPLGLQLVRYVETLLFICAYPSNKKQYALAQQEIHRITRLLQQHRTKPLQKLWNTGLPFTPFVAKYSHDCITWLHTHKSCRVEVEEFRDAQYSLNDILKHTLPTLEQAETTAGNSNQDLLDALRVSHKQRLTFLLHELSKLNSTPTIKDLLFDAMGMMIRVTPTSRDFSLAYNRMPVRSVYYHTTMRKRFDHAELLNTPLPVHQQLSTKEHKQLVTVIKNTMALTNRETDPVTYLSEESLRYYQLECGISVALFGITPERQLPLEQYIGYTLFKNGLPVAYGGSWVFGRSAKFGINVFEPYRGGESGYIMCQLLRVYKQVFDIGTFEVEPYQYGLDNPDGIATGAFWFYYRFGFRPVDKKLYVLANSEYNKIKTKPTYRTSSKTLLRFTESNIALHLIKHTTPNLVTIMANVTRMISRTFNSNRQLAEQQCIAAFLTKTGITAPAEVYNKQVLTEVALWAAASSITQPHTLKLLAEMIYIKPTDVYRYQQLLLNVFE